MADILHEVAIFASPDKVFKALTEQPGIEGWWTPHAVAEPKVGSIVEAHFARHCLFKDFFKSSRGLIRAVSGCGAVIELGGAVLVETLGEFRTDTRVDRRKRRQRNALALVIEDIESAHVVDVSAVLRFGFYVDLPLTTKAIKVVDEIAAHESLKGAIDVR